MEHEGTFPNPVFKLGLGIVGVNLIFPIIGHIGCRLVYSGSGHNTGGPRNQSGIIGGPFQGVLHAYHTFIIGKVAEKNRLKFLTHIIPHPVGKGSEQAGNDRVGRQTAHSVEGIGFSLIKIYLIGRIFNPAIFSTRQG